MSAESEHQVLCERYELERIVREDALGRTWRAIDLKGTAKVDVRMIPDWADRSEARAVFDAVKALKHPGIVGTLEMIADDTFAAYVLDANDGETMQQRRARRPRRHFEISEIKPWLRSIAEALACLHGQGRAHGALHIGSFVIEGADLKITDVAVAPLLLPQARCGGRAALPAAVMSPQVLASQKPVPADDIYALGALLFDLLTSQPLFSSGDIPTQVMSRVPPGIQERRAQLEIFSAPVPQPWEDWIAAALSKHAKRRPSLEDLGLLLRSGQFGGGTSQGTGARTATQANSPVSAAAATPARAKVPMNLVILGSSILSAVALMAGVYAFKVKPRREFKAALDAAYQAALNFDDTTPAQHDAVIQSWRKFEGEWQARVQAGHPESQSVLLIAQQKRQMRELLKSKDDERAREETGRKRKAYVAGARAALDLAKVKAAAAGGMGGEALAVWKEFAAKFDTDFEGGRPDEIAPLLAEARDALQSIEKAMAAEKKERDDFIAQRTAELADLDQMQNDDIIPSAEKVARTEAVIAAFASAPVGLLGDPSIAAIKSKVETKLEMFRSAVLAETSVLAQYPDKIFADPAAKALSKNERQRLLKKVQEALKTAGHFDGEPNGAADKSMRDAVVAFQKANDLPPTAALDEPTLAALEIGESADAATPAAEGGAHKEGGGSKSKGKPKEEKKSVLQKSADGVKKVGSAIGKFFSGGK